MDPMMISPMMLTGFSSVTVSGTFGLATLSVSASTVIKDFFTHLFLHPEKHFMAIAVMGAVVVAIAVGLAFLVKKVYEKVFPKPVPPP